ncbi:MAG: YdeI/OmpD-associated family protein [Pseudomonadota bacterium]
MPLTRPIQPMPEFVRQALERAELVEAYANRPPYQRNDYLSWINRAKRDTTKQKRLAIMLAELRAGKGYMGMDWRPRAQR